MKISYYAYPGLVSESNPIKIIDTVCSTLKLPKENVLGTNRKKELVFAREIICFVLRNGFDLKLKQIGKLLAGRDHSTVLHGIKALTVHAQVEPETYKILSDICMKTSPLLYSNLQNLIRPTFKN